MAVTNKSVLNAIMDLHSPWKYEIKNLGTLWFCEHCKDEHGRKFVSYPCDTLKIIKRAKGKL